MEYFLYLPEHRLLVCRTCKRGVIGNRIQFHLRQAPHRLSKPYIEPVQKWASGLDIIRDDGEIKDLRFPADDSAPIGELGDPGTNGLRCTFTLNCPFVASDHRRIREHLREKHGWDQKLHGGRRTASELSEERNNVPWRGGVFYQRFFTAGPGSEYFEVARGQNVQSLSLQQREHEIDLAAAMGAFQSKANQIRRQEAHDIEEQGDYAAPNPWLRRLGAPRHLKDFSKRKEFLRSLTTVKYTVNADDPDSTDDRQLQHIHGAFRRLVRGARAVVRPEVVSWNALFEANRKDLHKERTRPFHFRLKRATRERYTLISLQFLSYVVRAMAFEDPVERPPFRLSRKQMSTFDRMMEIADLLTDSTAGTGGKTQGSTTKQLEQKLEDAVLKFYLSVLDHFTKATEYDSVLVSFLMVLAVRKDNRWEGYGNFTPKLSAIMTVSRALLIYHAVDERAKSIKRKKAQGLGQEDAEENSPSHFDLVSDMMRRFMVTGGDGFPTTPAQFIIRLRNYGMYCANNEATPGSVSWDGEMAVYKGIRTSVSGVQAMLQSAMRRAESILFKDLLLCQVGGEQAPEELGLPAIPWDLLIDNAADETIGHSFVNRLYDLNPNSKGWLFRKIWSTDRLKNAWIEPDSNLKAIFAVNQREATQYGCCVEKFLEVILFLIHLSYGQPARGTELITIRHRNTANGGVRNIIADRGILMIVTGYHKGFSRSEREKTIHRFLPREISVLLTYYLWLVLPFWEDVQATALGKEELSASLWATEESLNEDDSEAGSGVDSYSAHRSDASQDSDDADRPPPQAAPPVRKAAGAKWTSARMSRIMQRFSRVGCTQGITLSSWRHLTAAIGRRYFRFLTTAHTRLVHEMDEGYGSDSGSEEENDSPWDTQACHGSATAGLVYGRLVMEGPFETNERRMNFRHISEEWHRLLAFPSALNGFGGVLKPGYKRKHPSLHYEAMQELQLRRWKILRRIDIDREIVRLYGERARFRGRQREAVSAIMTNKSPVVVVMGTGQGKSLAFMLPAASCAGGVTVVVVPLVSLLGDMTVRCRKLNIPCAEWASDRAPGEVALVFVTPESALTKRFHDYLEGLRAMARLDRFVVDECHTILEGTPAFRPKLRELGQLALVGVQIAYLTATLPPSKEDEFYELVNARREDVTMIRTRTTRSNIAYSVRSVCVQKEEDAASTMTAAIKELVDRKLDEFPWPAKIIIYCQRVETTDFLAEELGCIAYHREVDTRDGKAQRLVAWRSALRRDRYGRVLVATKAAGLGIDVDDIRVCINVEMPYNIEDYSQQSGRAGRDGLRSEAILLRACVGDGPSSQKALMSAASSWSDEYVSGRACRRIILDSAMDGRKDRVGCETGEEMCDVCVQQAMPDANILCKAEDEEEVSLRWMEVSTNASRAAVAQRATDEQRGFDEFRDRLEERRAAGCVFCWSLEMEPRNHSGTGCGTVAAPRGHSVVTACRRAAEVDRLLRHTRAMEDFGCCQGCFVPQELCNGWQEDKERGGWQRTSGRPCQYAGVMLSTIIFVVTARPEEVMQICSQLGFTGVAKGLWRWMGKRCKWAGVDANNMCRVFWALTGPDEAC